jgi:hypothetical protein
MLSKFWQQQVELVGIGFEMVSFLEFKFEFWCEKKHERQKRISSCIPEPRGDFYGQFSVRELASGLIFETIAGKLLKPMLWWDGTDTAASSSSKIS